MPRGGTRTHEKIALPSLPIIGVGIGIGIGL